MKTTSSRFARRNLACLVGAVALATAPLRAQNPATGHVVFLHGLLADSTSWLNTSNRLAVEYNFTPHRFTINYFPRESQQAQTLATDVATLPNGMGGVAKSNGALVLRTYLQNPGHIDRFVTVAGPNAGAKLADNVVSGRVIQFPIAEATDIAQAFGYYLGNDPSIPAWVADASDIASVFWWLPRNFLAILSQWGFVATNAAGALIAPVALDLSPSSAAVQGLNSTTGLQKAATAASIRAYIAADFGYPRDILFYTMFNPVAGKLSAIRWTLAATALTAWSYYTYDIDPYDPDNAGLRQNTWMWSNVYYDMLAWDPYWLDMIGVLHPLGNGVYAYDNSDGIVPFTSAILPGATRGFSVSGTSHQILNDDPNVYQDLRTLMISFGYATRSTHVNSVSVTPGANSIAVGGTVQLVAHPVDVVGNPVTGKTATWGSANTSIATVSSTGMVTGVQTGTTTISAAVDGYSGGSTVSVTSAPPTGITAVSISGPSSVRSGQVCTWISAVAGGVAPLSYVWKRGTTVVGNASSLDLSTPSTAFSLTVTATDRNGSARAATKSVSVSSGALACAQ